MVSGGRCLARQQLNQHTNTWGADLGGGRLQADPAHALTALNVHRLLITAVLLAGAARARLPPGVCTARLCVWHCAHCELQAGGRRVRSQHMKVHIPYPARGSGRAAKLTDDNFYNNAFYAKIGGVATRELNRLELELLKLLDFRLLVPAEELRGVLRRLRGAGAARTPAPAPAPARCLPSQPARPAAAGGAGPPRRSKKRGSEGERSASAPPPPAQARRGCQAAPAAEAAEAA